MAIIFTKEKKIQRSLIIVFVFLLIIAFIVLWQGLSKEETLDFLKEEETPLPAEKETEVDFWVFDHPKIKELVPFLEIEPFKEFEPTEDSPGQTKGRENPFLPY